MGVSPGVIKHPTGRYSLSDCPADCQLAAHLAACLPAHQPGHEQTDTTLSELATVLKG